MTTSPKPAIPVIVGQQQAARAALAFSDVEDFEATDNGLVGRLEPCTVRGEDGQVVWDNDSFAFLAGEAPDTVHPSLWRQSSLVARDGLFEVTDGIYQLRGMDLSNMTIVEGDAGVIVIDPLISTETAAAGLALYRRHRGDRPVTGVIYTHSHVDHFGGVRGVVDQADVESGEVPVVAPEGFLEHAVAENVYAGTAMARRAAYMYGAALARGPQGQVGAGLGQTVSTGTVTLIPPTVDITATGQEEVVDGVRMVFQLAPNTEAPSEMHFYFPEHKALCLAENATHNLHNLLTLRGAVVRDPHQWSKYLNEAIDRFGGKAEVAFASHHWPTWGAHRIVEFLSQQRDLYGYLHDQTLRMLNKGLVGAEIAEQIKLPPALEKAWHCRGYYGSVSHNVKAIYQRYMGWFDGNPAHLWAYPPVEAARRYVDFMGGAAAVVEKARGSYEAGDLRWVAEVLNHVVFAEPSHASARELLADTYEQLGYGSENGTWRGFYLTGAAELRDGQVGSPTETASADVVGQLTPDMVFDAIAVRVDGPRAWDEKFTIDVRFTDSEQRYRLQLVNGVLTYSAAERPDAADMALDGPRAALPALAAGTLDADALLKAGINATGDVGVLARLAKVLEAPDPNFAIVTPKAR
jgi:alkyl sulfatase BDS1-like metallo-beta-lactamase superfamily hydrolase